MSIRTSQSHHLQIAEVAALPGMGAVGLTFCPGKIQLAAMTGAWRRDLDLDLDAIRDWGAAAVVTLPEQHELESLSVAQLGDAVRARHMTWYHLPIPDVSVPGAVFETAWAAAGAQLRAVLTSGFKVLVHCMGGLGRAGMIAARLLVELSMPAERAVAAVRQVRPGAIETTAQHRHLLILPPLAAPAADTAPSAIRDRAAGALLGLAVGDALGTTLEFKPRDTYPPLTATVGGGPFRLKPGEWTDDTSMSLALADTLIDGDGFDDRALMARFCGWYERGEYSCTGRCFDIGNTVRGSLAQYRHTGDPLAGSADPMSAGNGSLMRLAPVAIRHWRHGAIVRDIAARQSCTTYVAPEAVDACIAFAEVLADAIAGRPPGEVLRVRDYPYAGKISEIMAGSWRGKHSNAIRSSGYVAHSLEAALWCAGRTGCFAEAVLLAANLGDDADTTAAITGQLAGALYGLGGIPGRWTKQIAWSERITETARPLSEAGEQA